MNSIVLTLDRVLAILRIPHEMVSTDAGPILGVPTANVFERRVYITESDSYSDVGSVIGGNDYLKIPVYRVDKCTTIYALHCIINDYLNHLYETDDKSVLNDAALTELSNNVIHELLKNCE